MILMTSKKFGEQLEKRKGRIFQNKRNTLKQLGVMTLLQMMFTRFGVSQFPLNTKLLKNLLNRFQA